MILFDRFAKLRKQIPQSTIHSSQKEILSLLRGTVEKQDPPALVVEPANAGELSILLKFAQDKEMRVAVADGLHPLEVRGLEDQLLILTHRLTGQVRLSSDGMGLWVPAGLPVESLAVELSQRGRVWMPLHPIEPGETMGSLFAKGFEGFRCHAHGGFLSHLRRVEWVGYDGELHASGPGSGNSDWDVTPLLYGSEARYGIFTRFELALCAPIEEKTLTVTECSSVEEMMEVYRAFSRSVPAPLSLPVWTTEATDYLRLGNDGVISDEAVTLIAVEAEGDGERYRAENFKQTSEHDAAHVNMLWQHLFRLPRTLARMSPHRSKGRYRLPSEALLDFDERARELARDRNLTTVIWGTLDRGTLHVWVLHPDGEARTARSAAELLERLAEDVIHLGGSPVENAAGMVDLN
ncbi:FAD-binding oxidoreductase, partial [bacterium]|nr:FAD-binding oxidoreductase [bacterium]